MYAWLGARAKLMDLQNAKLNNPDNAGGCANRTASDPETICLTSTIYAEGRRMTHASSCAR